jgi:hypothetical protein
MLLAEKTTAPPEQKEAISNIISVTTIRTGVTSLSVFQGLN